MTIKWELSSCNQALTTGTAETCWGRGPCTTPGLTRVWRERGGHVALNKEMLQGLFSGLPSISLQIPAGLFAEPSFTPGLAPLCNPPGPGAGGGVPASHWACGAPQHSHTDPSHAPCHHSVRRDGKGMCYGPVWKGQDCGGRGELSSCLSLPEQWLWLRDPWPSSERQQTGGNNEVAQLVLLLTVGTSLVSRGGFSDVKAEGRKWDRWVELGRFIQGRAKPENSWDVSDYTLQNR